MRLNECVYLTYYRVPVTLFTTGTGAKLPVPVLVHPVGKASTGTRYALFRRLKKAQATDYAKAFLSLYVTCLLPCRLLNHLMLAVTMHDDAPSCHHGAYHRCRYIIRFHLLLSAQIRPS